MKIFWQATLAFILAASASPVLAQTHLIPEWGRYSELGDAAGKRGDYNTAIINYRRARQVATEVTDPLLRQCSIFGAEAREEGAKAALEYLKKQGRSRATLAQAQRIQEIGFREAADRLFVGEYENGCP